MIVITLSNIDFLNNSLQVGDVIYARDTTIQLGAEDAEVGNNVGSTGTGVNHLVGVLRMIQNNGNNWDLHIDQTVVINPYIPGASDFIMFSKHSQGDAGVLGYYSNVKLVNDSKEEAEIFAVSSEVTINSK